MSYRIFTDATADFSEEMMAGLPEVTVIPMEITLGGIGYTYGPGGDIEVPEFYAAQRGGKFASTSQINPVTYFRYFSEALRQGEDILYLCFSSGLSGTFQTAQLCAEELREEFPNRTIICIDTRCASVGEGFLVREAARQQADGMNLEDLVSWVEAHKLQVCHWFTVDTFEHLKHGGRVSAATAVLGTALQIKPMLHVSEAGALEVAEKPRGAKHAMAAQLARMQKGWQPTLGRLVVVGHGDCLEKAIEAAGRIEEAFPGAEIYTTPIGPIIGSHTGPGMLAVIFWGSER